jgi:hypothetical protein
MHPFRSALEAGEIDDALALVSSDVVFNSPVAFSPYHGRESVGVVLRAEGARDQALMFRARVGDRELHGCDFLHIAEDGLIDEFTVMIRPLSAAVAFAEAMKAEVPVVHTEPGVAGA